MAAGEVMEFVIFGLYLDLKIWLGQGKVSEKSVNFLLSSCWQPCNTILQSTWIQSLQNVFQQQSTYNWSVDAHVNHVPLNIDFDL